MLGLRHFACFVGLALLLGCPRQEHQSDPTAEPPPIVHRTLGQSFAQLSPSMYGQLGSAPAEGISVGALLRSHDTDLYSRARLDWGDLPVIEFLDTDRRRGSQGAVAGWILAAALGDDGEERVEAVLLRDFVDAPFAPEPRVLLTKLGAVWPPPWTLCSPEAAADARPLLLAFDPSRGLKFGLVQIEDDDAGSTWLVDHVEFISAAVSIETWWNRKGYGTCDEVGTLLANGRFREAKARRE